MLKTKQLTKNDIETLITDYYGFDLPQLVTEKYDEKNDKGRNPFEDGTLDPYDLTDYVFEYVDHSKLKQIISVKDKIDEGIRHIVKGSSVLMEYNRRFDNSMEDALMAFYDNTDFNPTEMVAEAIVTSLLGMETGVGG